MKNIKQIQTFTKEDCDYMLSLASEWKPHNRYKQPGLSVTEFAVSPSKNLKLKKLLIDKLGNSFNVRDILYDEIKFIKYTKGVSFAYHVDSFTMKNNPQYPHGSYKTIIIMMTDGSDYKGGDLILYNDNKIIADKSVGSVLCYDSDIPHEVTEVTSGVRITALILLSTKDFNLDLF